jgi:hypothetical protein
MPKKRLSDDAWAGSDRSTSTRACRSAPNDPAVRCNLTHRLHPITRPTNAGVQFGERADDQVAALYTWRGCVGVGVCRSAGGVAFARRAVIFLHAVRLEHLRMVHSASRNRHLEILGFDRDATAWQGRGATEHCDRSRMDDLTGKLPTSRGGGFIDPPLFLCQPHLGRSRRDSATRAERSACDRQVRVSMSYRSGVAPRIGRPSCAMWRRRP